MESVGFVGVGSLAGLKIRKRKTLREEGKKDSCLTARGREKEDGDRTVENLLLQVEKRWRGRGLERRLLSGERGGSVVVALGKWNRHDQNTQTCRCTFLREVPGVRGMTEKGPLLQGERNRTEWLGRLGRGTAGVAAFSSCKHRPSGGKRGGCIGGKNPWPEERSTSPGKASQKGVEKTLHRV